MLTWLDLWANVITALKFCALNCDSASDFQGILLAWCWPVLEYYSPKRPDVRLTEKITCASPRRPIEKCFANQAMSNGDRARFYCAYLELCWCFKTVEIFLEFRLTAIFCFTKFSPWSLFRSRVQSKSRESRHAPDALQFIFSRLFPLWNFLLSAAAVAGNSFCSK